MARELRKHVAMAILEREIAGAGAGLIGSARAPQNEVRLFVGLSLRRRPGSFQPLPPMFATWSPEPGRIASPARDESTQPVDKPSLI